MNVSCWHLENLRHCMRWTSHAGIWQNLRHCMRWTSHAPACGYWRRFHRAWNAKTLPVQNIVLDDVLALPAAVYTVYLRLTAVYTVYLRPNAVHTVYLRPTAVHTVYLRPTASSKVVASFSRARHYHVRSLLRAWGRGCCHTPCD